MAQVHTNRGSTETVRGVDNGSWPGYDDLTAVALQGLNREIDSVTAQIAETDADLDYHEARTLPTTLTLGAATDEMALDSEQRVEDAHEKLERLEDYLGHLEVLGAGIEDGSNTETSRWFADLTPDA